MEDKQKICDLLLPALQATRNLHDLVKLKYNEETETVTAHFLTVLKRGQTWQLIPAQQ